MGFTLAEMNARATKTRPASLADLEFEDETEAPPPSRSTLTAAETTVLAEILRRDEELNSGVIEDEHLGEFNYEEAYGEGVELLKEAMNLLGFYGDAKLSPEIKKVDRKFMIDSAKNIYDHLDSCGELEDTDSEKRE